MNRVFNLNLKGSNIRQYLLLCFAFALPISLGVAELFLFLALISSLPILIKGNNAFHFRAVLSIPVVLYVLAVLLSLLIGQRYQVGIAKLPRLLFLLLIFVVPSVFNGDSKADIMKLVVALALGSTLNSVYDVFQISLYTLGGGNIYDAGSMTTPQFYMVSICLMSAIGIRKIERGPGFAVWRYYAFQILNLIGLIIHFKRGVWLATSACVAGLLLLKRRFVLILTAVVFIGLLILIPQVRCRLAGLPDEFANAQGGRWVLWTKVAPEIISQNPCGIGWQALTHEDLAAHADFIQPKLDHLHNNILQITAELGWLGGGIWVGWMVMVLFFMISSAKKLSKTDARRGRIALGALFGVVALLANGMVENNFDDSEIMLLYCLLIGISAAAARVYSPSLSE